MAGLGDGDLDLDLDLECERDRDMGVFGWCLGLSSHQAFVDKIVPSRTYHVGECEKNVD